MSVASLLGATEAFAVAIAQTVRGEARMIVDQSRHGPLQQNDRVHPGMTVTTGENSQVVLRFDDGQQVVLNANTQFKITDFRYLEAQPAQDRAVLELVKGALRIFTGAIARRNQASFALRAPQVTIGVRGTDFMVALVNPAYISVLQGAVAATNAAGTTVLGAGAVASVATASTLAVTIPASALPAAAGAAFSNMSAVTLSAVGAGTGVAGGAAPGAAGTAATAGGVSAGTIGIGVGAAAAAAAAASGGGSTTTTHH